MINIAIVDDNKDILAQLKEMITRTYRSEVWIETYISGRAFLDDVKEEMISPDIVFMDIELGRDNGIEIADSINCTLPLAQIIYISAYDNYYLDVYNTRHVFFLKKPFDSEKVSKAIETAKESISIQNDESLTFEFRRKKYTVNLNSISYMESSRRKIYINCINGEKYEFYGSLETLSETLPLYFIRCHRNFIVNMNYLLCHGKTELVMKDGENIPVSRKYCERVEDTFLESISKNV